MRVAAPEALPADGRLSTDEIDVVVSDRVEDVDEALAIVHDGFVEAGFATARTSGRRMHPAYLNPGTVFAVARIDGTAIGTAALIADGPFGLPSDRAFAEENDQMRAESDELLHECGSLAVRAPWRRHTRRIFMRAISALTRVAFEEFPDAPVPMAIAPESERFYAAMVGARRIAGPRPLYGAPAVLLRTSGRGVVEHSALGATSGQRRMDALINEEAPAWLTDRRAHAPLPADWLRALDDDRGVSGGLADQIRLLAALYPDTLHDLLGQARSTIAA
jgi:hypothetical protein